MKKNIEDLQKCANCGACYNVCPTKAIRIDREGLFYQPRVDAEKCISCSRCVRVCPLENPTETPIPQKAIWGKSADKEVVRSSSSGGIFALLAQKILDRDGVVFGAAFDDGCRSVSIKSTDEVSLSELKRSKYVESLVGDAFAKVKQALLENRWVLYSGTPCQIAGLKRYLGKNHERLITCDFTCGGLPSHALYEAHLQHLEEKYGAEVESVNFRPKTHGWSIHALRIDFKNQKKYVMPAVLDPFFCGFIRKHVNTRTACYTCRFEKYHESDIILADFWKYHAVIGDKHDNSGISLVLINTEKGERLITEIAPLCELHDIDLETASYNIRERTYSDDYMKLRERYLLECEAGGLQQAAYLIGFPKGVRLLLERLKFFVKGFKRKFQ